LATNGQNEPTLFWTQVVSEYIADLAITENKLAEGSVVHSKLGLSCVKSNNISPGEIGDNEIENLSITGAKIANDSVPFQKIEAIQDEYFVRYFTAQENNKLPGSKVLDNSANGSKLTDDTITEPKYLTGSVSRRALAPTLALPIGCSMEWNSVNAPSGWLFENGQAVSRVTYASLYAIIGLTFGVGDGATTFNLPDTRGRTRVSLDVGNLGVPASTNNRITHTENNPYQIAGNGGEEQQTLTIAQIPPHQHSYNLFLNHAIQIFGIENPVPYLSQEAQTGITGGGLPHNNMPPYILRPSIIYTGVA
jgi:microcystin-dependent protein